MNHQFDELTTSIAQSIRRRAALKKLGLGLAGMALAGLLTLPAVADNVQLSPLIEISLPNAVGACDDGVTLPGPWALDDAAETYTAVNPKNPRHIVTVWVQGPYQNVVAGVTFDGGRTWQRVPIPFTGCSGGPYAVAGNPWVTFAANGDVYVIAVAGVSFENRGISITKSTDGGRHWSALNVFSESDDLNYLADKPSITADPADPRVVYAVWDLSDEIGGVGDHTVFTRTTDGGATWEPARVIDAAGVGSFTTDHQIAVLPNGVLVCFFDEGTFDSDAGVWTSSGIVLLRSTDKGRTWSRRIPVAQEFYTPAADPETGTTVWASDLHSLAVDSRSGRLYVVWHDARFSNGAFNSVAFSQSADGGLTWSSPIRINQTPRFIPPGNQQTFQASIAVAADGTIGVSYYDFRFNNRNPGVPTDRWFVQCQPSNRKPATDPDNWGGEVRLTARSFDLEALWAPLFEYFVGDYEGLAATGNDFVTTFCQVDRDGFSSIFFRRIGQ